YGKMNIAHNESSVEFCVVTLFYTRPLWVFLCFQLGVALNITIRLVKKWLTQQSIFSKKIRVAELESATRISVKDN
uniref:hypothetical protein n=1 Tax=Exiguobacterium sp. s138 TaxID=2751202 RepID=UPI001BECBA21